MRIEITKTWETVFFTAWNKKKKDAVTIELSFNNTDLSFHIQEANEEGIRFDNVDLEGAQLKAKAVQSALDYVEEKIKLTN